MGSFSNSLEESKGKHRFEARTTSAFDA
uniref:Uncharacterized protein n=1 Tax=Anguilla anguilla TaxID=7936 RepID=A0A0E9WCL0_ANGAN